MKPVSLFLVLLAGLAAQDLRSPLYFNLDLSRPDPAAGIVSYQPAFVEDASGTLTFVWTAYRLGRERILSSTIRGARPSAERQISPGEGVYYQPVIVSTSTGAGWAFWMSWTGEHWRIIGRRQTKGQWSPVEVLSGETVHAARPAALARGSRVYAAWEEDDGTVSSISMRFRDGGSWSAPVSLSQPNAPCYRPTLAGAGDGSVWVFWDAYRAGEYAIFGRRVHPDLGGIERISSPGRSCLKPIALYGGQTGLLVAWLARVDVTGAKGVIDQRFSLHAAALRGDRWEMLADAGSPDIADLRHALLPEIEPKVVGLYGYQGRRRQPMLVEDRGAVWLLWERRIVHDGLGNTAGELCGRRFDGRRWSSPVSLHQGLLDYHVPADGRTRDGSLIVAAKGLHLYYMAMQIDLSAGKPFSFEDRWHGWEEVQLPLRPDPRRSTIEIDGARYTLYWADLHAHSGLTADAEGEVDELLHFARDKARLDVVAMQENDFIGRNLTEGEFRLSIYSSRRFTRNGSFVALPSYEWTQRHENGSRNHRTVMYAGADTPIVRYTENGNDYEALCDAVEAAGGVMDTQHDTFRLLGRPCEGNLEVASGWRVYIDSSPEVFHSALSDGYRVGFVATSDGHRRNPGLGGGLTGIYARELTPAAILDAIKDHRVYATNGSRIVLDARANGIFMGREVTSSGEVRLQLKVRAPRPVVRAVLVRDGREIHVLTGERQAELDGNHVDHPGTGYHWYYWRIELEGESPDHPANIKVAEGHLAWTSPHRVTVR